MIQIVASFLFVVFLLFGWAPGVSGAAADGTSGAEPSPLRLIQTGAYYQLSWEAEDGERPRQGWSHEWGASYEYGGWTFSSRWRWRPGGAGGQDRDRSAGELVPRLRLDGRGTLPLGEREEVRWEAVVLHHERPEASADPFRLFYPPTDVTWGQSAFLRMQRRSEHVLDSLGAVAVPNGLAAQIAVGGAAGDGIAWLRAEGGGPRYVHRLRWGVTFLANAGSGRIGQAWAVDGGVRLGRGDVTWGYARRHPPGSSYRAVGFARAVWRRSGSWWGGAEVYRRDEGFGHSLSGDLPWRSGTSGAMVRLGRSLGRWDVEWEVERAYRHRGGEESRSAQEVTWRPGGPWWLRLIREENWSSERYTLMWRWPARSVSAQVRYELDPLPGWSWRFDWQPIGGRLRLDWIVPERAWRIEVRREWPTLHLRIVYKQREVPSGFDAVNPGSGEVYQRQWFAEAVYRPPDPWSVVVSAGWYDLGRIDFHWNKPPRWELAWRLEF